MGSPKARSIEVLATGDRAEQCWQTKIMFSNRLRGRKILEMYGME